MVVGHTSVLTREQLSSDVRLLMTHLDIPADKDNFTGLQQFWREKLEGVVSLKCRYQVISITMIVYLDDSRRRHLVNTIKELYGIPVRLVINHWHVNERRSSKKWLLDLVHLNSIDDVPDDLLCPGSAALGVGHYPDVLLPHLHVVDEVGVVLESPVDRL